MHARAQRESEPEPMVLFFNLLDGDVWLTKCDPGHYK